MRVWLSCAFPFCTRHTSVLVPPMSKVMMLRCPARLATWMAPLTPPLGPEKSVSIGRSPACSGVMMPPPEFMMNGGSGTPSAATSASKLAQVVARSPASGRR